MTLDFRGFTLEQGQLESGNLLGVIGRNVTVKNGTLRGGDTSTGLQGRSLSTASPGLVVDNMVIGTGASIAGDGNVVRNSVVDNGLFLGKNNVVRDSRILNGVSSGGGSVIANNIISVGAQWQREAILVTQNGTIIEGNTIFCENCRRRGISVRGDGNRIAHNTIRGTVPFVNAPTMAIDIEGAQNQVDSNTVMPGGWDIGIKFHSSGNFHGGNRIAADVLMDAGTTTQTDWGGDVLY